MDISIKQEKWRQERPLFEAEFIHSHLLPYFNFNESTGDYEIKSECVKNADDKDQKVAYETLNTGWVMWLRAKRTKAQAVPEGFVLVERTDLECAIDALKWASNEDSDLCAKQAGVLEDVLKAQELTND